MKIVLTKTGIADWRIRIEKNTKVQQKLSLSDSDLGDSFHRLFF
jgi:hypothetical protein